MSTIKLLLTAGPTHEPIDSVRYIANRSSGRLGIALADEAARRGWDVTLLLGPTPLVPLYSSIKVHKFRTTADLQTLLAEHWPLADLLIMAAAVADYRPRCPVESSKIRRASQTLSFDLEPTPDLLAHCGTNRTPGQTLIGFALEPEDRLLDSAQAKLKKKHVDMIVANPLETMDSAVIRAVLVTGTRTEPTPGEMPKHEFAPWLLERIGNLHVARLRGQ